MEANIEKECSALGGLFQLIINDMKQSSPVWEDFNCKATKLHSSLRSTILAAGAFLDAFQRVADMATNTRGATKEIGSALTRLCMRHRSIEARIKSYTNSVMDSLIIPLSEKMEEWKKTIAQLDKDHAKEYKKARAEIKKASSDTIRLQKKVKKGKHTPVMMNLGKSDVQNRLDNALQDVNEKYHILEEAEKNSVRMALIEERSRFCTFISCIKPVVDEEIFMLTEITHLQEIIDSLCNQASDPFNLPSSSEQVILDIKKNSDSQQWSAYQTPPSSPSSLGSRKSSMCSISSLNSSSSGSTKSHSPSHHNVRYRNQSQRGRLKPPPGTMRLSSVSSQDSGFTSQDTLFLKPPTPPPLELCRQVGWEFLLSNHTAQWNKNSVPENGGSGASTGTDSNASTPSSPYPAPPSVQSTWTNWPEAPLYAKPELERPHTISTAYERIHHRPALTSQTFEPPDGALQHSQTAPPTPSPSPYARPVISQGRPQSLRDSRYCDRPPVGPKPRAKPVAPPMVPNFGSGTGDQSIPQPVYVNMNELANMAAQKRQELEQEKEKRSSQSEADTTPNSAELAEAIAELEASTAALQMVYDIPSHTSRSSLQCSSGYGTMTSTPSCSADTIPTGGFESSGVGVETEPENSRALDKFSTIPRNGDVSNSFKIPKTPKRPASTAGIPVYPSGTATIRRASMSGSKPPPPVRRSSSIASAAMVGLPIVPGMTHSQSASNTPTPTGTPTMNHRRTYSDVGATYNYAASAGAAEELQHDWDCTGEGQLAETPTQNELCTMSQTIARHLSNMSNQSDQLPPPTTEKKSPDKAVIQNRQSLIQSLEEKLQARINGGPTDGAERPPQPAEQTKPVLPPSDAPAVSNGSGSEPSTNSLLGQIKRGVRLRRTTSNDRSAPKLPKPIS